jgi:hypothetical protein
MSAGIYSTQNNFQNLDFVDLTRCKFYNSGEESVFFESSHDLKIAILEPDYQNLDNLDQTLDKFSQCDLVIVHSMELTEVIYDAIIKFDKSNFKFFINGVINRPLLNAKIIGAFPWLYSTAYIYQELLQDHLRKKLNPFCKKTYQFEVMYGLKKYHRTFVKSFLQDTADQKFYQTPYFLTNDRNINSSFNFDQLDLWENEIIVSTAKDYAPSSGHLTCKYFDIDMVLSQVLPFKIYSKTLYSLICETTFDNRFSFFTEKTAKPIIAQRLFIAISGQYFLRNLKTIGFKTFDSIINEDYDNIENNEERWTAALKQAVWLTTQNTDDIIKKLIPIALHNFEVIKKLESNLLPRSLQEVLLLNGYIDERRH